MGQKLSEKSVISFDFFQILNSALNSLSTNSIGSIKNSVDNFFGLKGESFLWLCSMTRNLYKPNFLTESSVAAFLKIFTKKHHVLAALELR